MSVKFGLCSHKTEKHNTKVPLSRVCPFEEKKDPKFFLTKSDSFSKSVNFCFFDK